MIIKNVVDSYKKSDFRLNDPKLIVLHSTSSYGSVDQLRDFHKSRGWAGVGYHFFIDQDGIINQTREISHEGAHALGFNTKSIGICYFLEKGALSRENLENTRSLISHLQIEHDLSEVASHTSCQIDYFNSLLPDSMSISKPDSICRPEIFDKYKHKIRHLITKMSDEKLQGELKKFKNCPGETFYEVLYG